MQSGELTCALLRVPASECTCVESEACLMLQAVNVVCTYYENIGRDRVIAAAAAAVSLLHVPCSYCFPLWC